MLGRKFKTVLLAAAVLVYGAGAARAATIGTFSLIDPDGPDNLFPPTVDVSNISPAVKFTDLNLGFCFGSVVAASSVPPGFYIGDGSIAGCSTNPVLVGLAAGPVFAGGGRQFTEFDVVPDFIFLQMKVWRVGDPTDGSVEPLDYFVDPVDMSCDPTSSDCTNFIYATTTSVPEPASLTLLAGVLGSFVLKNFRRRTRG